MAKPHNFNDFSSIFQTLENTRECLSAFSAMLDCVLIQDTGGALSGHAGGAIMMLDQQIEDLENISDALRCEVAALQRSKLQISDTGEIARMLGVRKSVVDYVVGKVFEVAAPPADADDEAEIDAGMMEALRENFSADEISAALRMQRDRQNTVIAHYLAGQDMTEIARMMNLRKGTVARIIDQIVEAASDSLEAHETYDEQPITTHKLSELVKETSKGHDAEEIGKALNLKASTVQKVIDVLMAGSKPIEDEATTQTVGRAVNE